MKKLLNLVATAMEEYGKLMDAYGNARIRTK
jgi:hypothetical protein